MLNLISLATAFKNAISSSGLTNSIVNVSSTKVRPANTVTYDLNDVINDNVTLGQATTHTFSNVVIANGGSGYITKASIATDSVGWTNAIFRLHLFSAAPTLINQDNAPFSLQMADLPNYLGFIEFDALAIESGTSSNCARAMNKDVRLAITADVNSRNIFGVVQTKTTLGASVSAASVNVRLTIDQV